MTLAFNYFSLFLLSIFPHFINYFIYFCIYLFIYGLSTFLWFRKRPSEVLPWRSPCGVFIQKIIQTIVAQQLMRLVVKWMTQRLQKKRGKKSLAFRVNITVSLHTRTHTQHTHIHTHKPQPNTLSSAARLWTTLYPTSVSFCSVYLPDVPERCKTKAKGGMVSRARDSALSDMLTRVHLDAEDKWLWLCEDAMCCVSLGLR